MKQPSMKFVIVDVGRVRSSAVSIGYMLTRYPRQHLIRGKRNFITPSKMELGFSLMFCLHEDSIANHIGERKPRLA
jgi:hypothetical protein